MSLETIPSTITYRGNDDVHTPYAIPFQFLSPTHLKVVVRDSGGVEQALTQGAFSVTQHANGQGALTTAEAWDDSHEIVITRVTPTTQPVSLEDGALIPAKTLERAFDRLTMIAQETRGYSATQETGPHASSHALDGEDPLTLSQSQISGLTEALAARATLTGFNNHVANTSNPHNVTKAQIGLGAVNNTSDADKPVSTATQSALDAKADKLLSTSARTGAAETLVITDAGKRITMDHASANTLTVPPHNEVALPVGCQILVQQLGAGATSVVAGVGVTIRSRGDLLNLAGPYAVAALMQDATDVWTFTGDRA